MLASHGCDVVVGDLRVEEGKFAGLEGRVTPLIVDVRDPGSVERAMTQLKDQFGRLDYLVNCAGTTLSGELATLPLADCHSVIDLNLNGPVHVERAAFTFIAAPRGYAVVHIRPTPPPGPSPG